MERNNIPQCETNQLGLAERLCLPPCSSSLSLNSAAGEPERDRDADRAAGDCERDREGERVLSRSLSLLVSRWLSRLRSPLRSPRVVRSRRLGERDLDREWERRRRRLKKKALLSKDFSSHILKNLP